jgi:O-methyltransferase
MDAVIGGRGGDLVRQLVRRGARLVRDVTIGRDEQPLTTQIIRRDARSSTFLCAIDYINYEAVPGDVFEFGVFTGLSLAQFAHGHRFDPKGMERRFVGFDSFAGLPPASEAHARWRPADCAVNHSWHPLLATGARVTPEVTRDLFAACGLQAPDLHVGAFAETVARVVPSQYSAIALLHLDCDLYESTRDALERCAVALQDGVMVMFDDWFHYRGNPRKGQSRAFNEFLDAHPEWTASPYRSYATFCQAFILSRR